MVRCIACGNLTRETRHCSHYNATIVESNIHRSIPCDGYSRKETT